MRGALTQLPPALGNQYEEDRVLRSHLRRVMPAEFLKQVEPSFLALGELAGGSLYALQQQERRNELEWEQPDRWGEQVEQKKLSPLWVKSLPLAVEFGLVAAGYERTLGRFSRLYQFALVYLFHPSTDVLSGPLAMTDGAVSALLSSGNQALTERAVPRLTSRDPERFWLGGQWMTELAEGSDVGTSEVIARQDERGQWRLWGRKLFTSTIHTQVTLTLARPEGNPPGHKGLALFYLELRGADGRLNGIQIHHLKDKLGAWKVPTVEFSLEGALAVPVMGLDDGVAKTVPMFKLMRIWNSVAAISTVRRGIALVRELARKQHALGSLSSEKALHVDTLAALQAEQEAGFQLVFFLIDLLGREECGELGPEGLALLRLLSSVVKLTTARQAVAISSELLECFGGTGYVEDTGLPALLRDSQVLPLWEGTTHGLALETLRALQDKSGLRALQETLYACIQEVFDPKLIGAGAVARQAFLNAQRWWEAATLEGSATLEAGARRFALTLGRSLALALQVRHAQWSILHENDGRARAAAIRFAASPINLISSQRFPDTRALANDEPLPLG